MTLAHPVRNGDEASDPRTPGEWFHLFYDELRRLAGQKLARQAPDPALQPTALVHEVWLRLADHRNARFNCRAHFFAAAIQTMRCILIDYARRKRAQRHGGERPHVDITVVEVAAAPPDERQLALHEALQRLAGEHPLKAELVRLRYFAGLTTEQAAQALSISEPTAKRYWTFARAWLHRDITRP